MSQPFHAGEYVVQGRAGKSFNGKLRDSIPDIAAAFLVGQPSMVVAGRDRQDRMWTTMLAGAPGFVHAAAGDPRTMEVDALPLPSDPLASLFASGGELGTIILDHTRRMRVNGILQPRPGGFRVHAEQVYSNCGRYISERHPSPAPANEPPDKADAVETGSDTDASSVTKGAELTDAQVEAIRKADTFFIGTSHPDGPADASHRGGNPGFVLVDSPNRLRWPDYNGNSMFMTLGNITLNPHVGLLFLDWATGGFLQVSGRAKVVWDPAAAEPLPGAERVVEMTVEAVQQTAHAVGLRWSPAILSRYNPTGTAA